MKFRVFKESDQGSYRGGSMWSHCLRKAGEIPARLVAIQPDDYCSGAGLLPPHIVIAGRGV
jgi:hypothetical protein